MLLPNKFVSFFEFFCRFVRLISSLEEKHIYRIDLFEKNVIFVINRIGQIAWRAFWGWQVSIAS
jgi:hypothetical protein